MKRIEKYVDKEIKGYNQEFERTMELICYKPPEYLYKEQRESENNINELKMYIKNICDSCQECQEANKEKESSVFDPSLRFGNIMEMKREDFFVLNILVRISKKILKVINANFDLSSESPATSSPNSNNDFNNIDNQKSEIISESPKIEQEENSNNIKKEKDIYTNSFNTNIFVHPCMLKKIMHNKYSCKLLRYLLKIIGDEERKYSSDINHILSSGYGEEIKYEKIEEDISILFSETLENINPSKFNDKCEQKIVTKNAPRLKAATRLRVSESDDNLKYKPCDHYPSECSSENSCCCIKRGFCLRYCSCYQESKGSNQTCPLLFLGCHCNSNRDKCKECVCRKRLLECTPGICPCDGRCTNKSIILGRTKKLLFGSSQAIDGGGLFAGENIYEGEFIDSYGGELVEKEELDRLSTFYDQTGNNYPFSVNKKFDFATIKCGGLTRYINHASFGDENVKAGKILVNGIPKIYFCALRDIEKYEELFYDYGYDESSMPVWMKIYNENHIRKEGKKAYMDLDKNENTSPKKENRRMNIKEERNENEKIDIFEEDSFVYLNEEESEDKD